MSSRFRAAENISSFRQVAASMWGRPSDPTIYGFVDVDVSKTLDFIQAFRADTGKRLTLTHLASYAVARVFERHPKLNAKVRFWGRVEQRESVDVFVSIATEGGKDLSGTRVEGADTLSMLALVEALESNIKNVRSGEEKTLQKSKSMLKTMPWWMARPLLQVSDVLTNELHLDLPGMGLPRDPFGSAIVTNVGSFGIDTAFAPFVPMGRCPMLLLLSAVKKRPVVVDDEIQIRPVLRLCASFDHRIIDGFQAGQVAKVITAYMEDPAKALDGEPAR